MATQTLPSSGRPVSRREFLFYLAGASASLTLAAVCGGVTWALQERYEYLFIPFPQIPPVGQVLTITKPETQSLSRWAFLAHTENGLTAFFATCPYHGCILKWETWMDEKELFYCPCCGSAFELDGTWIMGPSRRNMDQFVIEVVTPDASRFTPPDGSGVSAENARRVVLYHNRVIMGTLRPEIEG